MITVTNTLNIYKKVKETETGQEMDMVAQMQVCSHPSDAPMAVLCIIGEKLSVNAKDLAAALKNATNSELLPNNALSESHEI
jgi:hypothetical protein